MLYFLFRNFGKKDVGNFLAIRGQNHVEALFVGMQAFGLRNLYTPDHKFDPLNMPDIAWVLSDVVRIIPPALQKESGVVFALNQEPIIFPIRPEKPDDDIDE